MTGIAPSLLAAGMSERAADAKERLYRRCLEALGPNTGTAGHAAFFVPGRIEILGKHTDYAGGRSLLCTIERGFIVVARARSENTIRVIDALRNETRHLTLDPNLDLPRGDWSAYVGASIRRIARNFPSARRGADIAFASDLPPASGMSSSSALSTAIFLALDSVNTISNDPAYKATIDSREALAEYLGTIENGQTYRALSGDVGVGTFGGSEDHTAILCCRSGFVSRYSFAPVRAEGEIPFPEAYTFVVAHSGIAAEKGSGAQARYNALSLAVQRIVELWNASTGRADRSLAAAVESAPDSVGRMRKLIRHSVSGDFTTENLLDRLEHFVTESFEIIPAAAEALARGDMTSFGTLADRSQERAEALLRNQIPETIALARLARANGADAASAFGGGFGGSVWAIVEGTEAGEFADRWRESYQRAFPDVARDSEFIITRPGPGAVTLVS